MIKTVINTKGAYSGFAGRTLLKNIKYSEEKEIASLTNSTKCDIIK